MRVATILTLITLNQNPTSVTIRNHDLARIIIIYRGFFLRLPWTHHYNKLLTNTVALTSYSFILTMMISISTHLTAYHDVNSFIEQVWKLHRLIMYTSHWLYFSANETCTKIKFSIGFVCKINCRPCLLSALTPFSPHLHHHFGIGREVHSLSRPQRLLGNYKSFETANGESE